MKTVRVKDVMVSLADYATVSEDATLYDAVLALEAAQTEFDQSRYRHRAVLVYDKNKTIVGKISQMDVLVALEPNYQTMALEKMSRFGYGLEYMKAFSQKNLWDKPLRDICRKASSLVVKDFMYTPKQGEYIPEDATLDEAIHQLIIGKHQSLLVTSHLEITGILRLTDVFSIVCGAIKSCDISPAKGAS